MDETLANRYLEERQKANARVRKAQTNQAPATPTQGPQGMDTFGRRAAIFAPISCVVIATIIIAAIFTHTWALFGLLWIGLFMFGPAFFGGRRWRQDRWNRRYYRRYGPYGSYGPGDYDGSLPPGAPTPTIGYPQSQGYQQLPESSKQPTPQVKLTTPAPVAAPPPATTAPAPHAPMPPINPAG